MQGAGERRDTDRIGKERKEGRKKFSVQINFFPLLTAKKLDSTR